MTTTAETARACPPSAVHDMVTTWADSAGELLVFPGDLVLVGRTLECVEAIVCLPPRNGVAGSVRVGLEGRSVTYGASPGALVAVRRYDVSEG